MGSWQTRRQKVGFVVALVGVAFAACAARGALGPGLVLASPWCLAILLAIDAVAAVLLAPPHSPRWLALVAGTLAATGQVLLLVAVRWPDGLSTSMAVNAACVGTIPGLATLTFRDELLALLRRQRDE